MLKLSLWKEFLLLLVKYKDDRKVSLLKAKTGKELLYPQHSHRILEECYILQEKDLQAKSLRVFGM
jgi:anti-sigma factor ChrR (cupin superfamily)